MSREKVSYEKITCSRCGHHWTTNAQTLHDGTLTLVERFRAPQGGGDDRTDWDLCDGCISKLRIWMQGRGAT
jgi:hypothetical protein